MGSASIPRRHDRHVGSPGASIPDCLGDRWRCLLFRIVCRTFISPLLRIRPVLIMFHWHRQTCSGPDGLFAFILPFLVIIPVVLTISLVVLVWVTRALFLEFGWAVFHAIGTHIYLPTRVAGP